MHSSSYLETRGVLRRGWIRWWWWWWELAGRIVRLPARRRWRRIVLLWRLHGPVERNASSGSRGEDHTWAGVGASLYHHHQAQNHLVSWPRRKDSKEKRTMFLFLYFFLRWRWDSRLSPIKTSSGKSTNLVGSWGGILFIFLFLYVWNILNTHETQCIDYTPLCGTVYCHMSECVSAAIIIAAANVPLLGK